MSLVLDAGAFIAIDRGDREIAALIKHESLQGRVPRSHGGVVGQVWRHGARQALLARALRGIEVIPLDETLGRRSGELLARSGTSDVVDAALVAVAAHADILLTSDPDDLAQLASAAGTHLDIVSVRSQKGDRPPATAE